MRKKRINPLIKVFFLGSFFYLISLFLVLGIITEVIKNILLSLGVSDWLLKFTFLFGLMSILFFIAGGLFLFIKISNRIKWKAYFVYWKWAQWKYPDYIEEKTLTKLEKLLFFSRNQFKKLLFLSSFSYFRKIIYYIKDSSDQSTIFLETCVEDFNNVINNLFFVTELFIGIDGFDVKGEKFEELNADKDNIYKNLILIFRNTENFFNYNYESSNTDSVEKNSIQIKEDISQLIKKINYFKETYEEICSI